MASDAPRAQGQTARQALWDRLLLGPQTLRDLSQALGLTEQEVLGHLEHLQRSVRRSGRRLEVTPAACLACGYRFEKRRRLGRPGACPQCRATRIVPPSFQIS